MLAVFTSASAEAQSVRSSHVIVATVEELPDDGTVAVLKRFADPRQKDVIFLESKGKNEKALQFALAALRHDRFVTPEPVSDITFALQGARTSSASTPAFSNLDKKKGTRLDDRLAKLDAKKSKDPVRELTDAFLP